MRNNALIRRLKLTIVVMIFLFGILAAGSFFPLESEEAEELTKKLEEIFRENVEIQIFLNNFMIAAIGYIPFVGPGIISYTIFHTGRYLGWISARTGVHPIFSIFFMVITVYGLLEFMGYGLATAESITLSYQILRARHLLKREIKLLLIMLALSVASLLAAALIEGALIRILGAFSPTITEYL